MKGIKLKLQRENFIPGRNIFSEITTSNITIISVHSSRYSHKATHKNNLRGTISSIIHSDNNAPVKSKYLASSVTSNPFKRVCDISVKCQGHLCDESNLTLLQKRYYCRICHKVYCELCIQKDKTRAHMFPLTAPASIGTDTLVKLKRCHQCTVLRCLGPYYNKPYGAKVRGTVIERINVLSRYNLNLLIKSSLTIHTTYHVSYIKYTTHCQDRFPSLWDGAKVGRGGSGTVFQVEDRAKNNMRVAVKVIDKTQYTHCMCGSES